jgi:D-alanine-D-alanine ligase
MGPKKLRVAVLFGGRSAEHEISLLSARNVVEALDRERFEPVLVGIDKDGRWLLQKEALLLSASRDPRLQRLEQAAPDVSLAPRPTPSGEGALVFGDSASAIDVVFPVLHGPMGEDGAVQGLLELAGVPYVGAGVAGSAVGMDKDLMKRLLAQAGLPLVPWVTLRDFEVAQDREGALARCETLGYPLFVKPANLGSSVGVSRAKDREGLARGLDEALLYDTKVVIEAGVPGVREIECAVLGNDAPMASIPGRSWSVTRMVSIRMRRSTWMNTAPRRSSPRPSPRTTRPVCGRWPSTPSAPSIVRASRGSTSSSGRTACST